MKIACTTNLKVLRSFIGLVNYYRDMWKHRSEIIAPLTELTSEKRKWTWTDKHQKAFEQMKKNLSLEVILAHPAFSKPFVVCTDVSDYQLGAVINQDAKPIAFYLRKLNAAQTCHTTTEKELLVIIETLREFKIILLGQRIVVYTDHKNSTYKTHNSARVMLWRLTIEEFGPEFIYLPGDKNIVVDSLSRLHLQSLQITDSCSSAYACAEHFALEKNDLPSHAHPLSYNTIMRHKQNDADIINTAKSSVRQQRT